MLMTSAPRRLPATSKEVRVRVEFSKKQLISVRPRSREFFFSACRFSYIAVGEVEDKIDVLRGHAFDAEQMPVLERIFLHEAGTIGTAHRGSKAGCGPVGS